MTFSSEVTLVIGMALVTFGVRYPILALVSRFTLAPSILAALKYIPPAILAAIIVPAILAPKGGGLDISLTNAYLVGGVIAALLAWRTRNLLTTIVLGMILFWTCLWLVRLAGWA